MDCLSTVSPDDDNHRAMSDKTVSVTKAVADWDVSERTVRSALKAGDLAATKSDDGTWQIEVSGLDERWERRPNFTLMTERLDALAHTHAETADKLADRIDDTGTGIDGLRRTIENHATQTEKLRAHNAALEHRAAQAHAETQTLARQLATERTRTAAIIATAALIALAAGVLIGWNTHSAAQNAQTALTTPDKLQGWIGPAILTAIALTATWAAYNRMRSPR